MFTANSGKKLVLILKIDKKPGLEFWLFYWYLFARKSKIPNCFLVLIYHLARCGEVTYTKKAKEDIAFWKNYYNVITMW